MLLLLPPKSPPVSKRAATSLVLSKPLPALSLSYPYKVVFRLQPEHILIELSKLSGFQVVRLPEGSCQLVSKFKNIPELRRLGRNAPREINRVSDPDSLMLR